ncbi:MAG: hypothetical protein K0S66_32 [Sphingomonas sp.]|jgi:hypothetical protein|nr:hypothetical protein [Sphingomonas sp.]
MSGRAVLAGAAGLIGGAAIGLLVALAFVHLWHNVLGLPPLNDDPKPGIAMLGGVVPISMGTGALLGTAGMVRRARREQSLRLWLVVFAVALAVILAGLAAIIA